MTATTIYRNRYRFPSNRSAPRTQARDRGLLGRTHQPIRPRIRRRHPAPRHLVGSGRRRPGLGADQHLLLLRPDARHRGSARRPAGPGERDLRRTGPLLRRRTGQRRRLAAGDDQVVRHQLPLPGSRDRAVDQVLAEPRQGALRAERSPGAGNSRPSGDHRTGHLPAAQQGRGRRSATDRAARRSWCRSTPSCCPCLRTTARSGCSSTSPRWLPTSPPTRPRWPRPYTTRWARWPTVRQSTSPPTSVTPALRWRGWPARPSRRSASTWSTAPTPPWPRFPSWPARRWWPASSTAATSGAPTWSRR